MNQEKVLAQFTKHEYRELFTRLRVHVDKTQQEIADELGAPLSTYRKWESGQRKPRSDYRRELRDKFEEALFALGYLKRQESTESQRQHDETVSPVSPLTMVERQNAERGQFSEEASLSVQSASSPDERFPQTQAFLTSDITMRLLALAELPFREYHLVQQAFARALKEIDAMVTISLNYDLNRREALSRVMGFPFAAIAFTSIERGGERFPPTHAVEGLLARCATGIAACKEIYSTCDTSQMSLALESVSRYIPVLQTIARQSSQHRENALELAARSAILRVNLALECLSSMVAIGYALEAVDLSQETNNVPLQLSALSKLAFTYYNTKRPSLTRLALTPAEKGTALLVRIQSKIFLPSSVKGATYSIQSIMQAINHLSPDMALGNATEVDPSTLSREPYDTSFTQFTPGVQITEAGLAQYHSGNPQAALEWFTKRIDPETLEAKVIQGVRTTERGRIYTINAMIPAALATPDRDKEQIIKWWMEAIEGAKRLKSENLFDDALLAYEGMKYAFPGDHDILELGELGKHWAVEG